LLLVVRVNTMRYAVIPAQPRRCDIDVVRCTVM